MYHICNITVSNIKTQRSCQAILLSHLLITFPVLNYFICIDMHTFCIFPNMVCSKMFQTHHSNFSLFPSSFFLMVFLHISLLQILVSGATMFVTTSFSIKYVISNIPYMKYHILQINIVPEVTYIKYFMLLI